MLHLELGFTWEEPERVWRLPDLQTLEFPKAHDLEHRLDDGRWLVHDNQRKRFSIYEHSFESSRLLYEGDVYWAIRPDGLEVLDERVDGRLWFVPWDGENELLAHRATTAWRRFPSGQVLTQIEIDENGVGVLMAVDPKTLVESFVDDRVLVYSTAVEEDDILRYVVLDGERSGVWLTNVASP